MVAVQWLTWTVEPQRIPAWRPETCSHSLVFPYNQGVPIVPLTDALRAATAVALMGATAIAGSATATAAPIDTLASALSKGALDR